MSSASTSPITGGSGGGGKESDKKDKPSLPGLAIPTDVMLVNAPHVVTKIANWMSLKNGKERAQIFYITPIATFVARYQRRRDLFQSIALFFSLNKSEIKGRVSSKVQLESLTKRIDATAATLMSVDSEINKNLSSKLTLYNAIKLIDETILYATVKVFPTYFTNNAAYQALLWADRERSKRDDSVARAQPLYDISTYVMPNVFDFQEAIKYVINNRSNTKTYIPRADAAEKGSEGAGHHFSQLENVRLYYQILDRYVRAVASAYGIGTSIDIYLRNACVDMPSGDLALSIFGKQPDPHQIVVRLIETKQTATTATRNINAHSTGSGKTVILSQILSNFFNPATLVFPTDRFSPQVATPKLIVVSKSVLTAAKIVEYIDADSGKRKKRKIREAAKDLWSFIWHRPDIVRAYVERKYNTAAIGADERERWIEAKMTEIKGDPSELLYLLQESNILFLTYRQFVNMLVTAKPPNGRPVGMADNWQRVFPKATYLAPYVYETIVPDPKNHPDKTVRVWRRIERGAQVDQMFSSLRLVIDEAHNLFNRAFLYDYEQEVMEDFLLRYPDVYASFITATPYYESEKNLATLLRMTSADFFYRAHRQDYLAHVIQTTDKERVRTAFEPGHEPYFYAITTADLLEYAKMKQAKLILQPELRASNEQLQTLKMIESKVSNLLMARVSFVDAYRNVDKFPALEEEIIQVMMPVRNRALVESELARETLSPLERFQQDEESLLLFERAADLQSDQQELQRKREIDEQDDDDDERRKEPDFNPDSVQGGDDEDDDDADKSYAQNQQPTVAVAAAIPRISERTRKSKADAEKEGGGGGDDNESDDDDIESDEDQDEIEDLVKNSKQSRLVKNKTYARFSSLGLVDQQFVARALNTHESRFFNVSQWYPEQLVITSPTLDAILLRISARDHRDIQLYGKTFQHAIYVADTATLAMVTSFMFAQGYGHVSYNRNESTRKPTSLSLRRSPNKISSIQTTLVRGGDGVGSAIITSYDGATEVDRNIQQPQNLVTINYQHSVAPIYGHRATNTRDGGTTCLSIPSFVVLSADKRSTQQNVSETSINVDTVAQMMRDRRSYENNNIKSDFTFASLSAIRVAMKQYYCRELLAHLELQADRIVTDLRRIYTKGLSASSTEYEPQIDATSQQSRIMAYLYNKAPEQLEFVELFIMIYYGRLDDTYIIEQRVAERLAQYDQYLRVSQFMRVNLITNHKIKRIADLERLEIDFGKLIGVYPTLVYSRYTREIGALIDEFRAEQISSREKRLAEEAQRIDASFVQRRQLSSDEVALLKTLLKSTTDTLAARYVTLFTLENEENDQLVKNIANMTTAVEDASSLTTKSKSEHSTSHPVRDDDDSNDYDESRYETDDRDHIVYKQDDQGQSFIDLKLEPIPTSSSPSTQDTVGMQDDTENPTLMSASTVKKGDVPTTVPPKKKAIDAKKKIKQPTKASAAVKDVRVIVTRASDRIKDAKTNAARIEKNVKSTAVIKEAVAKKRKTRKSDDSQQPQRRSFTRFLTEISTKIVWFEKPALGVKFEDAAILPAIYVSKTKRIHSADFGFSDNQDIQRMGFFYFLLEIGVILYSPKYHNAKAVGQQIKNVFNDAPSTNAAEEHRDDVLRFSSSSKNKLHALGANDYASSTTAAADKGQIRAEIRFIVFDSTYSEGIDLLNTKYIYMLEEPSTLEKKIQIQGRVGRRCSHKSLPREQGYWKVKIGIAHVMDEITIPNWAFDKTFQLNDLDVQAYMKHPATLEALKEIQTIHDEIALTTADKVETIATLRRRLKELDKLNMLVQYSKFVKSLSMSYTEESKRTHISALIQESSIEHQLESSHEESSDICKTFLSGFVLRYFDGAERILTRLVTDAPKNGGGDDIDSTTSVSLNASQFSVELLEIYRNGQRVLRDTIGVGEYFIAFNFKPPIAELSTISTQSNAITSIKTTVTDSDSSMPYTRIESVDGVALISSSNTDVHVVSLFDFIEMALADGLLSSDAILVTLIETARTLQQHTLFSSPTIVDTTTDTNDDYDKNRFEQSATRVLTRLWDLSMLSTTPTLSQSFSRFVPSDEYTALERHRIEHVIIFLKKLLAHNSYSENSAAYLLQRRVLKLYDLMLASSSSSSSTSIIDVIYNEFDFNKEQLSAYVFQVLDQGAEFFKYRRIFNDEHILRLVFVLVGPTASDVRIAANLFSLIEKLLNTRSLQQREAYWRVDTEQSSSSSSSPPPQEAWLSVVGFPQLFESYDSLETFLWSQSLSSASSLTRDDTSSTTTTTAAAAATVDNVFHIQLMALYKILLFFGLFSSEIISMFRHVFNVKDSVNSDDTSSLGGGGGTTATISSNIIAALLKYLKEKVLTSAAIKNIITSPTARVNLISLSVLTGQQVTDANVALIRELIRSLVTSVLEAFSSVASNLLKKVVRSTLATAVTRQSVYEIDSTKIDRQIITIAFERLLGRAVVASQVDNIMRIIKQSSTDADRSKLSSPFAIIQELVRRKHLSPDETPLSRLLTSLTIDRPELAESLKEFTALYNYDALLDPQTLVELDFSRGFRLLGFEVDGDSSGGGSSKPLIVFDSSIVPPASSNTNVYQIEFTRLFGRSTSNMKIQLFRESVSDIKTLVVNLWTSGRGRFTNTRPILESIKTKLDDAVSAGSNRSSSTTVNENSLEKSRQLVFSLMKSVSPSIFIDSLTHKHLTIKDASQFSLDALVGKSSTDVQSLVIRMLKTFGITIASTTTTDIPNIDSSTVGTTLADYNLSPPVYLRLVCKFATVSFVDTVSNSDEFVRLANLVSDKLFKLNSNDRAIKQRRQQLYWRLFLWSMIDPEVMVAKSGDEALMEAVFARVFPNDSPTVTGNSKHIGSIDKLMELCANYELFRSNVAEKTMARESLTLGSRSLSLVCLTALLRARLIVGGDRVWTSIGFSHDIFQQFEREFVASMVVVNARVTAINSEKRNKKKGTTLITSTVDTTVATEKDIVSLLAPSSVSSTVTITAVPLAQTIVDTNYRIISGPPIERKEKKFDTPPDVSVPQPPQPPIIIAGDNTRIRSPEKKKRKLAADMYTSTRSTTDITMEDTPEVLIVEQKTASITRLKRTRESPLASQAIVVRPIVSDTVPLLLPPPISSMATNISPLKKKTKLTLPVPPSESGPVFTLPLPPSTTMTLPLILSNPTLFYQQLGRAIDMDPARIQRILK